MLANLGKKVIKDKDVFMGEVSAGWVVSFVASMITIADIARASGPWFGWLFVWLILFYVMTEIIVLLSWYNKKSDGERAGWNAWFYGLYVLLMPFLLPFVNVYDGMRFIGGLFRGSS